VRKTDENGVVDRYTYDVLGRLVHLATPDGGHTFDGFDGSVTSDTLMIVDPAGTVKFASTKETVLDGGRRIAALKG